MARKQEGRLDLRRSWAAALAQVGVPEEGYVLHVEPGNSGER